MPPKRAPGGGSRRLACCTAVPPAVPHPDQIDAELEELKAPEPEPELEPEPEPEIVDRSVSPRRSLVNPEAASRPTAQARAQRSAYRPAALPSSRQLGMSMAAALQALATGELLMPEVLPPPSSSGGDIVITFTEDGSLGLKLNPDKESGRAYIRHINAGTQADRHSDERLRVGLVVKRIDETAVAELTYTSVLELLKLKRSSRPCTLAFEPAGGGN